MNCAKMRYQQKWIKKAQPYWLRFVVNLEIYSLFRIVCPTWRGVLLPLV